MYKDGDLVVDLHGCAPAAADYDGDTLQNVFSSGKNLEAIAVMMLADSGLLRYEDKVADHWPAFARHGKGAISVEDALRPASSSAARPTTSRSAADGRRGGRDAPTARSRR